MLRKGMKTKTSEDINFTIPCVQKKKKKVELSHEYGRRDQVMKPLLKSDVKD